MESNNNVINFKINKIEKCGVSLKLYGFDDINEDQNITIKIYGDENNCCLVITPKEEEPQANRITANLKGKDIEIR